MSGLVARRLGSGLSGTCRYINTKYDLMCSALVWPHGLKKEILFDVLRVLSPHELKNVILFDM